MELDLVRRGIRRDSTVERGGKAPPPPPPPAMSQEMDVDDAIKAVGGFGRAQKKVFYLTGLYQVALACHMLILSFVGEDPGWSCQASAERGAAPVTEATEKCHRYESGNCSPEYSPEFTSIVTEVMQ